MSQRDYHAGQAEAAVSNPRTCEKIEENGENGRERVERGERKEDEDR